MTRMFTADGEYMLITIEQWEQLDTTLAGGDVERARELWLTWQAPSWPETAAAPAAEVAGDGESAGGGPSCSSR